jgi:phosphohistidine phosphatase
MNLYLLRHGLAVEPGTPGYNDSERPLIPKGRRKLEKIGDAMAAMKLEFDLVLSSPYLRARQTAEIVVGALKLHKVPEFSECLTPSGSIHKLVEVLTHRKPAPEEVLLVGHEPYLSETIALLVSGETGFGVVMKKGGLCKVSAESLRASRCGRLEWLLTPKQMALMA